MSPNEPVLQHYVPQLYLRNFVDSNNHVVAYDRKSNRMFVTIPKNVAAERNFYTLVKEEDPYCVEKNYAAEVEPRMQKLLAHIITQAHPSTQTKTCILSPQQKEDLSYFMVVQLLRGKTTREFLCGKYDKLLPKTMEEAKIHFGEKLTPEIEQQVSRLCSENKDLQKQLLIDVTIDPERLKNYAGIIYRLYDFVFLRIVDSEMEFITSDNPVMIVNTLTKDATPFHNGILENTSVINYPISPKILLRAHHKDLLQGSQNSLDRCVCDLSSKQDSNAELFIRTINRKQYEQCHSYIYARSKEPIDILVPGT